MREPSMSLLFCERERDRFVERQRQSGSTTSTPTRSALGKRARGRFEVRRDRRRLRRQFGGRDSARDADILAGRLLHALVAWSPPACVPVCGAAVPAGVAVCGCCPGAVCCEAVRHLRRSGARPLRVGRCLLALLLEARLRLRALLRFVVGADGRRRRIRRQLGGRRRQCAGSAAAPASRARGRRWLRRRRRRGARRILREHAPGAPTDARRAARISTDVNIHHSVNASLHATARRLIT